MRPSRSVRAFALPAALACLGLIVPVGCGGPSPEQAQKTSLEQMKGRDDAMKNFYKSDPRKAKNIR